MIAPSAAAAVGPSSRAGQAQAFYEHFHVRTQEIEQAIAETTDPAQLASPLQDLSTLRAQFGERYAQLPTYDADKYEIRLRTLVSKVTAKRAQLNKASGKRFAFRRPPKRDPMTSDTQDVHTDTAPARIDALRAPEPPAAPAFSQPSAPTAPAHAPRAARSFANQENAVLLRSSPLFRDDGGDDAGGGSIHLTNLEHCLVDLRPPPSSSSSSSSGSLRAVQIRNVSRSLLLLDHIDGSVMLHGCSSSLLLVRCRQYRMHDSRGTACLLATNAGSTITLEGCRELRLGLLPASLTRRGGEIGSANENFDVQDFDHISSGGPSPNWTRMADDKVEQAVAALLSAEPESLASDWQAKMRELQALLS